MKIQVFILGILLQATCNADTCQEWFRNLKIVENCKVNCAIGQVGMGTYMCPNQCDRLCKNIKFKKPNKQEELGFYGLTESEIKFCNENKLVCVKAYSESLKAEKYCLELYPQSGMNDESDACRHFVWAVLLEKSIGSDSAESILNAHENNPTEPSDQKSMDLANNRLGQLTARKIKTDSSAEILAEFKTQMKRNKFIIIDPKFNQSGGLP